METSLTSTDAALQSWDDYCARDDARQNFVIPTLHKLVNQLNPAVLVDVGARTGYLIKSLSGDPAARHARLIALDQDADAATYMRHRLQGSPIEVIEKAIQDWDPVAEIIQADGPILTMMSYTILELDDQAMRTVFNQTPAGGLVAIFVPDAVEDAVHEGRLDAYLTGQTIRLAKNDPSTGLPYLFLARRLETWLPWALDSGLKLNSMKSHRTPDGHAHFFYQFSRGLDE